jgi:hypothetical protein
MEKEHLEINEEGDGLPDACCPGNPILACMCLELEIPSWP